MKIELEKSLALPVPQAVGWNLLENIEDIATCVPGAKITQRIDATHYKGTITVKLGPATVSFRGDIEIVSLDPAAHTIRIVGQASDTTGSSGASLDLTASVKATGAGTCELTGRSEVSVTGKVAAFGSRLMGTVTDQLLKVFFANLLARAEERKAAAVSVPAGATVGDAPAVSVTPAKLSVEAKFNALAFAWAVAKDFFLGLFGRTNAS
jgi:carbon monoxide dehydrogenase subunit G